MSARRREIGVLYRLPVLLLLLTALAAPAGADTPASTLESRITELRHQARYAEAVEVARELLALERSDRSARPHRIADSERLLATVELAAALNPASQRELAYADSLGPAAEDLYAKGDYAEAAAAVQRQLDIRRRILGAGHPEVGWSLGALAVYLEAAGDHSACERLFREALTVNRNALGEEHPETAAALENLGNFLRERGDYLGAEACLRRTLAIRSRVLGEEHADVANSLNDLAVLRLDQGDYAAAESLCRKALPLWRRSLGDDHSYVAVALVTLATLMVRRGEGGDYAAADSLYREALTIDRKNFGEDHPDVTGDLYSLAFVQKLLGRSEEAEAMLRRSLDAWRGQLWKDHPLVAMNLSTLAQVLYDRGEHGAAEPLLQEALAIWRRLLGENHPDVMRTLMYLGMIAHARGRSAQAESLLSLSAQAFEGARLRAGSGLERATFEKSPYPYLAAVRLELGKSREAWPAVERFLARSLAELLEHSGRTSLKQAEVSRRDSLLARVSKLERRALALDDAARQGEAGVSEREREAARGAWLAAEAEWSALQAEMAAKYSLTEGQAFPLERVQAALPERAAIVGWLDVEVSRNRKVSWAYLLRRAGPVAWARLDSTAAAISSARELREVLAAAGGSALGPTASADAEVRAQALWRERFGPLGPLLAGVEQLVVIPSGAMVGLPVEALIDPDGELVGDRHAVSYAPSATVYAWLRESPATPRDGLSRALLLGDPPFREEHLAAIEAVAQDPLVAGMGYGSAASALRGALAGNDEALAVLPRLRGSRQEVSSLASLLPSATVLLGRDASEQALVQLDETDRLRSYRVLHFATHALIDDERPERSALVLAQTGLADPLEAALGGRRIYDGLLTAGEIVREWTLDADLVTLSACETALGREVPGEGMVGFAHAFMQAGARALLVTLWKVDDEATALLMRRFYENWTGGYGERRAGRVGQAMPKAEALREAKRWLRSYRDSRGRQPFRHPCYWSAFVLFGDTE